MTRTPKPRYSVPTLGAGSANAVERRSDTAACFAPRTSRHSGPILPLPHPRWWHRFL